MVNKQTILLGYFRHGKSERQLVRETGISRPTIHRYIEEHLATMGLDYRAVKDKKVADRKVFLNDTGIVDVPKYNSTNRKKRVLTSEIADQIDTYLAANKQKREIGQHKQQMKKIDILEALLSQGYQISYTTVCNYVRRVEKRGQPAYIRQHYEPGETVEFDWGEVKLYMGGKLRKIQLAVFTYAYSNYRCAYLFDRQDQQSFLDAHRQFFHESDYVASELVYDNMRVAVKRFSYDSNSKQATDALLQLSSYYLFDIRFCNLRSGHEKGHVERSVEYVRRKAFCQVDRFDDLASANQYLHAQCQALNAAYPTTQGNQKQQATDGKANIAALFKQECEQMRPIPPRAYDTAQISELRVDKYSCIKVDTNHYSVPDHLVAQRVKVKKYAAYIEVYDADYQFVCKHTRYNTRFERYLDIHHFLPTLSRKSNALKRSLAFKQSSQKLQQYYQQYFQNREKEFIQLLLWFRQQNADGTYETLFDAIDKTDQLRPHKELCTQTVKLFLQGQSSPIKESTTTQQQLDKPIEKYCQKQLLAAQQLFEL